MDSSATLWRPRAVLHVDMDAFFASVEQLDHPEWRGRPVVVGGSADGRGVVAAASYEARTFGVRSAMPSAQAKRLCPDAVWTRGRFDRYREISRQVCDLFASHTPHVQQVSIDEAFLDVTPTEHRPADPREIARAIQRAVDDMGLSCSIGVATSRTVAKIASDHDKPHGITVVPPGEEAGFLAPLPVRALPGIGPTSAQSLRAVGIRTLGDLAALDAESARQLVGSSGPELARRARGVDDRPVLERSAAKSLSREHTFATDIHERADVQTALRGLVTDVSARLRSKRLKGRTLTVKLRYADFTTRSVSRTLSTPTNLEGDLARVALELLAEAWTPGAGLRLVGFGVSGFGPAERQLSLLDDSDDGTDRAGQLARSVDAVRERFGSDAVMFGPGSTSDRSDGKE